MQTAFRIDEQAFSQLATAMSAQKSAAPREPLPKNALLAEKRRLVRLLLQREYEGLRLYEPLPLAEQFHACNAVWRLADGSNRCLGGEQTIYDPVQKRYRRVDSICGAFHVLSRNPRTGSAEICAASRPFVKAVGQLRRFRFSNGQSLIATAEHRVVAVNGRWISLGDAWSTGYALLGSSVREGESVSRAYADEPTRFCYHNQNELQSALSSSGGRGIECEVHLRKCSGYSLDQYTPNELAHSSNVDTVRPWHGCSLTCLRSFDSTIVSRHTVDALSFGEETPWASSCQCDVCDHAHPSPTVIQGFPNGCLSGFHSYDEQSLFPSRNGPGGVPLLNDAPQYTAWRDSVHSDGVDDSDTRNHLLPLRHPSTPGATVQKHLLSGEQESCAFAIVGKLPLASDDIASLSEKRSHIHPHIDAAARLRPKSKLFDSSHPSFFSRHNSDQSVYIVSSETIIDKGYVWDFTVEPHANYLAAGLINANSGKTMTAAAELARALAGTDPYDKYPKHNGNALVVGLERKHLQLLYRALLCEGQFKIIKDEHTGLYRSVRYNRANPAQLQAYDEAYREKWKDAPPLIPERLVKRIGFDEPEVPRFVHIHTGWRSLWQSAAGEPPQGEHWSLCLFDEEQSNPEFYKEAHRGLTPLHETHHQRPKGMWSATSQVANVELAELREKAAADPESDFVRQFVFLVDDNPYVTVEGRKQFWDGLSEQDRLTRYHGIPASQVRRIYPTYRPMGDAANGSGHGCEPFEINPAIDCRYVIIDPSIQHCAVLFAAIDPAEQFLTIYDGFDLSEATGRRCAAEIAKRQQGAKFECAILDQQMGKESQIVRDKTTVAREYWAALMEYGVQFRQRGSLEDFFPGSNDVNARTQALLSLLEVRGSGPFAGSCALRVMRGLLPELDKQIRRAQTDPKNPAKRLKNPKVPQDFLDDLEYAAAGNLHYHTPEPIEPTAAEKELKPYHVFLARERDKRHRRQYAVA